ncbi:MAG TPA: PAS domain S-box protein [Gemmatimonadales bacterium]|nr:PAS domain S-box protein [Gemmatimonadales bacterium]
MSRHAKRRAPSGARTDPRGGAAPPASDPHFRKLVEHSSDVITLLDAEGTILYMSPAITPITGYQVDEVVGRRAFDFVHADDLAACLETLSQTITHPNTVLRLQFRARHKSGAWLTVEGVGVSRLDDPGVRAVVVNFRDITDRTRAEEALRQSEAQYRALMEHAVDAIVVTDSAGRFLDANAKACEVMGYTRGELLQLTSLDTYCAEDRQAARDRMAAMQPGESSFRERVLRRKDGTCITIETSLKRLADGRFQGVFRDITERRRAEDRLQWLTRAVEQSPAGIVITDPVGNIQYVNEKFTAVTGYTAADVIGQNPRILQSGLTPRALYCDMWATLEQGQEWRGELCNRRKDGALFWVSAAISPIRDARGAVTHFLAVQEHTTERKQQEAALHVSGARLRRLIEANILGIGFWEISGAINEANDEYLRMVGYTRDDLDRGLVNFRTMTPPEYAPIDARAHEELAARGTCAPWEKELIRKDGRRVPVLVGIAALDERGAQGVSFVLDLTARRLLEQQLRQAQKMEAVGRLAGGVAHDFNNILTAITGYSELLRQDLTPGHPGHADVAEIRRAADRAAGLTRQLLAFSRQQVLEPRVLDLNDLVRNMEKLLHRLLGEDIVLATELAPELGAVKADPGQLEQVIMNLAVNSRDAMPSGGKLTIETVNIEIGDTHATHHEPLQPGRYVMVAVSDTGTGMTEATKARIFEPFFTTKEKGKGTGLGLSTVYGIVKQSGGFIWVYSEPGQGATFKIYLPRVDEAAEALTPLEVRPAVTQGTETILVAEDEESVRVIVRETLERHGYRVLQAKGGAAALALAAAHAGPVHLLVSDVVMPEMSGRELATRLVAERPTVRVLYMSGYTDDAVLRRDILEAGSAYLQKPFGPELLLRKVRAVLDGAP